jgi:phosphoribosylformylglycinamidine synthase
MMFAQANSEHCRHKIFNASWTIDGRGRRPQPVRHDPQHPRRTFAGRRPVGLRGQRGGVAGPAASRFAPYDEPASTRRAAAVHLLMKVETHNHPTAIAPFPGAGTGVGGEIRDEGAVGRGSKPKAGLTASACPTCVFPGHRAALGEDNGRPARIVSALDIMLEGPIGGAAFNNEFGRPNLCGYFRSYEQRCPVPTATLRGYHKPIMIAGGFGNIAPDTSRSRAFPPGTPLLVLGGPAMLIGLGGGAASSMASADGQEDLDFASVQRQNPEMERRCQEVIDRCWQLGDANPIAFIHDVGAGGLSNALPELVKDGGCGGAFRPARRAQRRPGHVAAGDLVQREPGALRARRRGCRSAALPGHLRARALPGGGGRRGQRRRSSVVDDRTSATPVDMPMDCCSASRRACTGRRAPGAPGANRWPGATGRWPRPCSACCACRPVASKSFLITIGDRTVTGLVGRDQMVGPWQVPVADCAVTLVSYDSATSARPWPWVSAPRWRSSMPGLGRMAVAEAITNLCAAPARSLADVRLSANWMAAADAPGEGAALYDTVRAWARSFCPALGIAIPVGKDSMSMQTRWRRTARSGP